MLNEVSAHYSRGDLLDRLRTALAADGADPDRPTAEALAPYDPPHRAVALIHGEVAREAMANSARALQDGRVVPIELLARKRRP